MSTFKKILILLVFIISTSLYSCKTKEVLVGEITGRVTDAETSQPLQETKVVLNRFLDSTTTTSDGKYLFQNLNPADYNIQASKAAYEKKTGSVSVTSGNTTELNFALNSVPEPAVSQKYLDFGIDSTSKHFTISSTGDATFNYSVLADQSWIDVQPASGVLTNGSVTLTVTINKSGLSGDIYHGDILIISIIGQETLRDTVRVLVNGVMDTDHNYYSVIRIGTQTWMAENINVGSIISGGLDQSDLQLIKRYCYSNITANCDIYGGLYTWAGMMHGASPDSGAVGITPGICPVGWHIPTVKEWTTLTSYLGETVAGLKLKEAGTAHWMAGTIGNNESGFTALPTGYWDGSYYLWGHDMSNQQTYFWTATDQTSGNHSAVQLEYNSEKIRMTTFQNKEAVSVRCLMNPPE
jgi:uncharacterized protein (TIGR02145 family)